jgi:hypothetical protein
LADRTRSSQGGDRQRWALRGLQPLGRPCGRGWGRDDEGRGAGLNAHAWYFTRLRDRITPLLYGVQALAAALAAPFCYLDLNHAHSATGG